MRYSDYAVMAVAAFVLTALWFVHFFTADAEAMTACAVLAIVVLVACNIYIFGQGRWWE